ncbi:MAG: hypothetical protein ACYDD0_08770, partial [Candidatus Dormibacteria bacterium]
MRRLMYPGDPRGRWHPELRFDLSGARPLPGSMRRQNRTFSALGHVGPLLRAVAVESEPVMDGGGLDAIDRRLAPWVERWDLARPADRSRREEMAGYVMARPLTPFSRESCP